MGSNREGAGPQMHIRAIGIAIFALFAGAAQAHAADLCGAAAPAVGAEVHGPVLHVIDGRRFCIALGDTPDRWVELELADQGLIRAATHTDANPRGALMSVAFAQNITCKVIGSAGGRPLASCALDGQALGALATKPQAISSGRAWR
jgi:hypothetical protein